MELTPILGDHEGNVFIRRQEEDSHTVLKLHDGPVHVIVINDDHILTAGKDGIANILFRNSVKTTIRVGTPIYAGAFSNTSNEVILAGIGASAVVYSVATGEQCM